MSKKCEHLKQHHRFYIYKGLQEGKSIRTIARELGFSHTAIEKEVHRGHWHAYKNKSYEEGYRWKYAQNRHDQETKKRGRKKMYLGQDPLMLAIQRLLAQNYSPEAAIQIIKKRGVNNVMSVSTLYRYIYSGAIPGAEQYLVHGKRSDSVKEQEFNKRRQIRHPGGLSIEERPKSVLSRKSFGHWEGDLVVGPTESHACLLTLVERMTRYMIVLWVRDKTQQSIVEALDEFEKSLNVDMATLFKTVTWDNGVEFANGFKLKRSVFAWKRDKDGEGGRIGENYYAHPYCSSERGTNENSNGFIRRFYPKGTKFETMTIEDIEALTDFINTYPRKILNWECAKDVFDREFYKLPEAS